MTEIYRDIAWKLINLRQGEGLTQKQLGQKVGLSQYQMSRLERGHGEITFENLNILAKHYEIPLAELFRKTEKMDIEIKKRIEYLEKSQNNFTIKNYAKAFSGSAKIRSIDVHSKSIRKMKIEINFCYEIYVLDGSLTVRTHDDSIEITKTQMLSIKGSGTLKLVNIHSKGATILTIAY